MPGRGPRVFRVLTERPRRALVRRARQFLKRPTDGIVVTRANPSAPDLPGALRLFAVLGTWMDEDVVEATVRNAFAQGIEAVYLVDKASTDATVARAVAAGATVAETYDSPINDERVRTLLMNDVVARVSLASGAEHVWWLWLDADEFPEGPDGMTIAAYLATLDRRFRMVGSTYYSHFPSEAPSYIPGFHPLDFQPLCQRYVPDRERHCSQPHWKHPLQRFDRRGPFLAANAGFHSATVRTRDTLLEPRGGIVTHLVPYRDERTTRAHLALLAGATGGDAADDSGRSDIGRRLRALDAVYARRWGDVDPLGAGEGGFGVHPVAWSAPPSARWYSPDDLRRARDALSPVAPGP